MSNQENGSTHTAHGIVLQELDVNGSNSSEGEGGTFHYAILANKTFCKYPYYCPLNPIYLTAMYWDGMHSHETHSSLFSGRMDVI